jgi:mannitol-1-phosphate/altronate dehydrogenase
MTASDLSPGIVHIGVGNFHRAHQAWYLHRLMQQGDALDWAIIGAGVRSGDAAMRERLSGSGLPDHTDRTRSLTAARPKSLAR